METEHLNHDCSTLPNMAINPDITNELLLDSEMRNNTKTILENVCSDFESIDVFSSKENKLLLFKKLKTPGAFSEYSNDGSDITNFSLDRSVECEPSESVFFTNAATRQADSIQKTAGDENALNSHINSAEIIPSLDSQNQASNDCVNSVKNTRTEMLPFQDPSKVGIHSDNLSNDKSVSSSLAELADAEIIQTSENAVSIIISNPRFIQVLNSSGDTSNITLNSNCIVSEKENLNDAHTHTIVEGISNYDFHQDNFIDKDLHTEVANEIVYSENEVYNFPHTEHAKHSTPNSKEKRPYYRSRADLGKMAVTRARRITAKMKSEWLRILHEKGFLVCPLSGCSQKYKSIANFLTHYKYCYSGEKNLKQCPYCASVIFSSQKAVLHHMKVEHPEKLDEYKANHESDFTLEDNSSRLLEISQKSLKNHKHKLSIAKENRLSPKSARIFKNKIKAIKNEPVNTKYNNIQELRECKRFSEIVSKISSVNKESAVFEKDENKLPRKKKLVITGHVVTPDKYFEDEHDENDDETIDIPMEEELITKEKQRTNTKSRLVLNMDRYRRYTQYLTVTRDFGSARRTYSRPKSASALDSSNVNLETDFNESDINQLNSSLESSSISLNETNLSLPNNNNSDLCCVSPEISAFDPLPPPSDATPILNPIESKTKKSSIVTCETQKIDSLSSPKINGPAEPIKAPLKIPCYKPQINVCVVTPPPPVLYVNSRKTPLKISPIITYGKIPETAPLKKGPDRLDFDSLVKNSVPLVEKAKKHAHSHNPPREDGIKLPNSGEPLTNTTTVKRRGRPRKERDSSAGVLERPSMGEFKNLEKTKEITEKLRAQKNLKAFQKTRKKYSTRKGENKTNLKKKGRKITKKSKGSVNRISSKIKSKFLKKNKTKKSNLKSSAKSSLKKAIMCGRKSKIEHNTQGGEKKRAQRAHVCIKSLLKNSKPLAGKQKKIEKEIPLDHNYSSSFIINERESSMLLKKSNLTDGTVSESICDSTVSLKEIEDLKEKESGILPPEIALSSTVLENKKEFNEAKSEEILPQVPIPPVENASANILNSDSDKSVSNTLEKTALEHVPKASTEPIVSSPVIKASSNLYYASVSPPQNNENDSTQTPVIIKRSRGRPRKSYTTPQETKTSEETPPKCIENSSIKNDTGGVRKSERVRKRKFGEISDDTPPTQQHTEKSHTEVTPAPLSPNTPRVNKGEMNKTGRRGRPRKYPRIDKDEETHVLVEQSDAKNAEIKIPCSQLKTPCGRRGRPRREPKEPEVTIIRSVKDKTHTHKEPSIEKEDEKNFEHKDVCAKIAPADNLKKDEKKTSHTVLSDSYSPFDSERKKMLILPLKKRRKLEKGTNSVSPSSALKCEITVEKEKTTIFEKKGIESEKDAPLFCKTIMAKKMTTQNTEAEKVAKLDTDKIMQGTLQKEIFETLKPNAEDYKVFSNQNILNQYLETSISVSSTTCEKFIQLKCFNSVSLDDLKSSLFFTGGSIQSSAFCPIPSNMSQRIAISSNDILRTRQNSLSYVDFAKQEQRGLIQIWNLGILESSRLKQLPSMEFALEHQHGVISQMRWCPKGCFDPDDGEDRTRNARIGLLALACSDSYIRIYSIPDPKILTKTSENAPIYKTNPKILLNPLFSTENFTLARRSIAICLDWHQNTELIAAGFGNGSICVWSVKMKMAPPSNTAIVTSRNEDDSLSIIPFLFFDASGTPVTSIQFAPLINSLYLVSSSWDKTLRFWDLRDTSMPFCSIKRGFAMDDACQWAKGFCGALVSLHDGIIFKGSTFTKEAGTEEFPTQNIAGTFGSLTCSAISEITDMQAIADMTGTVSVNFFHGACDKQPSFDTYVLFECEVVERDKDEKASLNEIVNSLLNDVLDIIEVVMDKFTKLNDERDEAEESQKREPHNEYPALKDLMNNLLESVENSTKGSTNASNSRTMKPVKELSLNSEERRLNKKIENEDVANVSPISSSGDFFEKEGSHISLPVEEMSHDVLPISERQLETTARNDKKLNISSQLNTLAHLDENASVSSSKDKNSIDLDCANGTKIGNCTKSKLECCSKLHQSIIESMSHTLRSCNAASLSLSDESFGSDCNVVSQLCIESKSSSSIVPQHFVESDCNASIEDVEISAESVSKSKKSHKFESSVQQKRSLESELNVIQQSKKESVELKSNEIQQSKKMAIELESNASQQSVELKTNVVQPPSDAEHDVTQQAVSECSGVQRTKSQECNSEIQKSIESNCISVPQLKSPPDADSSDISIHLEESDDSISMISECSYASDSCDSIHSFLSDSLAPDTPSECPTAVDHKQLSPVPSSSTRNNVACSELNFSRQPTAAKESMSKVDNSVVFAEKVKCVCDGGMPLDNATLVTENQLKNCVSNSESDLNHTPIFSDKPQTFDSKRPECFLLQEKQKCDSIVPNCLLSNNCDNMETVGGETKKKSSSNENLNILESDILEFSPPCKPQYQKTSMQFLESENLSVRSTDAFNSEENMKELFSHKEENPVSYASLISTYGLIFKDVNKLSSCREEQKDSLPVESNVLSSVNTLAWNPNYGCHFWLFTAGNSGVARLICVSELSPKENTSPLEEESIM